VSGLPNLIAAMRTAGYGETALEKLAHGRVRFMDWWAGLA
jgi:microsomal dipeptidase-like Zn-dependent dipeptidase